MGVASPFFKVSMPESVVNGKRHCSRGDLFLIFKDTDFANYLNENTRFGSEETPEKWYRFPVRVWHFFSFHRLLGYPTANLGTANIEDTASVTRCYLLLI